MTRVLKTEEQIIQEALTRRWLEEGPIVGGEKLFLVAWEINDNYTMNRTGGGLRGFRKSVDFWFLDRHGKSYFCEYKPGLKGEKESLDVLCQVSHRTAILIPNLSLENLGQIYSENLRYSLPARFPSSFKRPVSFQERFADSVNLYQLKKAGFARIVAALEFDGEFQREIEWFNSNLFAQIEQAKGKSNQFSKEVQRFLSLKDEEAIYALSSPIFVLECWQFVEHLREFAINPPR